MSSAHIDTFARDSLPPVDQQPQFIFDLPELQFPPQLNCATELLDRHVNAGNGSRICIRAPGGLSWTYADLQQRASRIATGVLLFVLVGCSAAAFNGTPLMGLLAFFLLVPLTFLTFFQTNISKKITHLMQLMADEGAREVQKKAFDESPTHDALPPKRG